MDTGLQIRDSPPLKVALLPGADSVALTGWTRCSPRHRRPDIPKIVLSAFLVVKAGL
jgi:hypothetical protein